jgi:pyridoxine 4-dehydrogenase
MQAGAVSFGNEISVHRFGYGAMRLTGAGVWGPPKDRKAALEVLRRATELGVKFIDTAGTGRTGKKETQAENKGAPSEIPLKETPGASVLL